MSSKKRNPPTPEQKAAYNATQKAKHQQRMIDDPVYRAERQAYRKQQKAKRQARMAADPEFKRKTQDRDNARVRERCKSDPEYKKKRNSRTKPLSEAKKKQNRDRYANDPVYRQMCIDRSRKRLVDKKEELNEKRRQRYHLPASGVKEKSIHNYNELKWNIDPTHYCNRMYRSAKSRAAARGIPFTITKDDIIIPTHCPILGMLLMPGINKTADSSPSLDKIYPSKGYVPGNVQVISYRANSMKYNASFQEMVMLGEWASKMLASDPQLESSTDSSDQDQNK